MFIVKDWGSISLVLEFGLALLYTAFLVKKILPWYDKVKFKSEIATFIKDSISLVFLLPYLVIIMVGFHYFTSFQSISLFSRFSGDQDGVYYRTYTVDSIRDKNLYLRKSPVISDIVTKSNLDEVDLNDVAYDFFDIKITEQPATIKSYIDYCVSGDRLKVVSLDAEYVHKTTRLKLTGLLKTSYINNKLVYTIGDYKLFANSEENNNKILSALSNNTNVNIDLCYNSSSDTTEELSDFKIISADTL